MQPARSLVLHELAALREKMFSSFGEISPDFRRDEAEAQLILIPVCSFHASNDAATREKVLKTFGTFWGIYCIYFKHPRICNSTFKFIYI